MSGDFDGGGPLIKLELPDAAADRLRSLIVSGRLTPGRRLVERQVAELLGISRTPVREAFFRLVKEGLITNSAGRGLAVSELTALEITGVYQAMAALERAAMLHSPQLTPQALAALEKADRLSLQAGNNIDRVVEADVAWHRTITGSTTSQRILELLGPLRRASERYERAFFATEGNHERSRKEHQAIRDALAAGGSVRAAGLLEEHWLGSIEPMRQAIFSRGRAVGDAA